MLSPAPYYSDVADGPEGAGHFLTTSDGVRLRLVHWRNAAAKASVIIFPGRTEYCEKYSRIAADLHRSGFDVVAIDWRGQGLSDRVHPDRDAGHIDDFSAYQLDADAYLDVLRLLDMPGQRFLLAHSMGGCIGLRRLYGDHPFEAAVFSAPMWGVQYPKLLKPIVPLVTGGAAMLRQLNKYAPGTDGRNQVLADPFADNRLTTDRESWDWMAQQVIKHPELSIGGPTLGWARAAEREMTSLAAMPAPALPALTLLGGNERIVCPDRIRERMAGWPDGLLMDLPGLEHESLIESATTRGPIMERIVAQLQG